MKSEQYVLAVNDIRKNLPEEKRNSFDIQMMAAGKSPTTALMLSLFLGGLGIDRFYLGHIGLGVGKLVTMGGLGIWAIVDWFLIQSAAREVNLESARLLKLSL